MNDFTSINILRDSSGGLIELKLVPSHRAKRAFAIQNNIDGRFTPADMQTVQVVAKRMSQVIGSKQDNEIVVGFTEGSVLLAGEIARVRQSPFICTTKTQKPANAIVFQEEHRDVNATHNLLAVDVNMNILLIEDEITKGKTILNICASLQTAGYKHIQIASLVETTNFGARELIKEQCEITIRSLVKIELK